ncbi:MAG: hypothetical protein EOP49_51385, partial [Sphingobacteriales bacterium]
MVHYKTISEWFAAWQQPMPEHPLITVRQIDVATTIRKGEPVASFCDFYCIALKRVVGIIQDITESKLAEKAVKVSQAELLEAQTIAKIGNWKWDSTTNMLSWSDEVNSIYEIEGEDTVPSRFGRMLLHYIHPDDKYIVKHLFKSGDNSGSSYECRIITPKGHTKYI